MKLSELVGLARIGFGGLELSLSRKEFQLSHPTTQFLAFAAGVLAGFGAGGRGQLFKLGAECRFGAAEGIVGLSEPEPGFTTQILALRIVRFFFWKLGGLS